MLTKSIVAEGAYEDNEDYGIIYHYFCQSGKYYKGEKQQVEDKKKELRTRHLWNATNSYLRSNLMQVQTLILWLLLYHLFCQTWVGTSSHKVYKFNLKQIPNQPELHFENSSFNFQSLLNVIKNENEFWTFNKIQDLNKIQQNWAKERPHKSFHSYIKIIQCSFNTLN